MLYYIFFINIREHLFSNAHYEDGEENFKKNKKNGKIFEKIWFNFLSVFFGINFLFFFFSFSLASIENFFARNMLLSTWVVWVQKLAMKNANWKIPINLIKPMMSLSLLDQEMWKNHEFHLNKLVYVCNFQIKKFCLNVFFFFLFLFFVSLIFQKLSFLIMAYTFC